MLVASDASTLMSRPEPASRSCVLFINSHLSESIDVKFLVWIGIAMVICWGVLWLGIKMAIGAVHLLLLLGVVLIAWGMLHKGGAAPT